MTIEQYLEWMAFDFLESRNPEEISAQSAPSSSTPSWMQQKMSMLHYFNLFGKRKK